MRWLEGKLPAPKVLCYEKDEEHQYLLMSKVPGIMACDDYYLEHPKWGREYAFTRRYTKGTYNLVKGGIPVKQLLQVRSKDRMIMKLVAYTGLMMSYFMDEINWMAG